MKKISFLIASVIIALSVSACGGAPEKPADTDAVKNNTANMPSESSDEYDINMKNAKLNLDLVE